MYANNNSISVENADVNSLYSADIAAEPTLLEAYEHDLMQMQQRVGIDRAKSTIVRHQMLRRHVVNYLEEVVCQTDIALSQLTPSFITDYATYLSTRCHLRGGTVWLACQQLKGVVTRAYQRGLMQTNPFYSFHIGRNIRQREFLTEQELQRLIQLPLDNGRQAFYRDVFVFSALTGMSFVDISHLTAGDVYTVNGEPWIDALRHKTQTPYQVKLLSASYDIICRYNKGQRYIFTPLNYRTLAKHIPLIMAACGIGKHITFHCARHTFAVMALNAGLPIESVSRVLGHTNITTTQIYAKITLQKLGQDMDRLGNFLEQQARRFSVSQGRETDK